MNASVHNCPQGLNNNTNHIKRLECHLSIYVYIFGLDLECTSRKIQLFPLSLYSVCAIFTNIFMKKKNFLKSLPFRVVHA